MKHFYKATDIHSPTKMLQGRFPPGKGGLFWGVSGGLGGSKGVKNASVEKMVRLRIKLILGIHKMSLKRNSKSKIQSISKLVPRFGYLPALSSPNHTLKKSRSLSLTLTPKSTLRVTLTLKGHRIIPLP